MPVRKTTFLENAHYHIFNRGIENRVLFEDEQDCQTFLDSLVYYLEKLDQKPQTALSRTGLAYTGLFKERLTLYAYCIMPTHFHLLFHQKDNQAIPKFMQRVGTAYSMYFNRKHKRSGTLFQGRFRIKHIDTDDYLLESTKYIHRTPNVLEQVKALTDFPYSSYRYYVTKQPTHKLDQVINLDKPLGHLGFKYPGISYQDYVEKTPNIDWFAPLTTWLE